MSNVYQCGRVTIGAVSVPEHRTWRAKFVTVIRPMGCECDAPGGYGKEMIDVPSTRGGRVGLRLFRLDTGDFDFPAEEEIRFNLTMGREDARAEHIGDAELLSEGGVHKQTGGGGDTTEYFFQVQAQDHPRLGTILLDKAPFVLLAMEDKAALPPEPEKKVKDAKPDKDYRQVDLVDELDRRTDIATIDCPGCDDGKMALGMRDGVELWICQACPYSCTPVDPLRQLREGMGPDLSAQLAALTPGEAAETLNLAREELATRGPLRCPHCEDDITAADLAVGHKLDGDVWHERCWQSLAADVRSALDSTLTPDITDNDEFGAPKDDASRSPGMYSGGVSSAVEWLRARLAQPATFDRLHAEDLESGTDAEFSQRILGSALEAMLEAGEAAPSGDPACWYLTPAYPGPLACTKCSAECDGTIRDAKGHPVCVDHAPKAAKPKKSMAEASSGARRRGKKPVE
jgi:hypothetical protein